MGGRFGKYGDVKRHQALQKSRYAKHRLEGLCLRSRVRRRSRPFHPAAGAQQAQSNPVPSPDDNARQPRTKPRPRPAEDN